MLPSRECSGSADSEIVEWMLPERKQLSAVENEHFPSLSPPTVWSPCAHGEPRAPRQLPPGRRALARGDIRWDTGSVSATILL